MVLVNYDGEPVGGGYGTPTILHSPIDSRAGNMSRPANTAGFMIHSAVHKARSDVIVACHTHSPHGMAWSGFVRPLEMLNQDAAYLYGKAQAVYKVRYQRAGFYVETSVDERDRTLAELCSHMRRANASPTR
jgi:ribulose-5-phosphate 4-epimerase/fuculose-1-phosphate aldolase